MIDNMLGLCYYDGDERASEDPTDTERSGIHGKGKADSG